MLTAFNFYENKICLQFYIEKNTVKCYDYLPEFFVKRWRNMMKKFICIALALVIVFAGVAMCLWEEKQTDVVVTFPEEVTSCFTQPETTTEETTTEQETETTTKPATTKKPQITKPASTSAKPLTTEAPIEPVLIDFSDVDCEGIDPNKPMIALTFDDGPSVHTPRLLDMFEKYGGKGTFFVVGNLIDRKLQTVTRIVNDGHEIANHSWTHPDLKKLSAGKVQKELTKTHDKIFGVTGVNVKFMRPPYGSYNNNVKKSAYNCTEAVLTWSVDTIDWKTRNADSVYRAVMSSAYDGAIILCHDLHGTTVDAMERVIPDLQKKGYQLVTVSQLYAMRGYRIYAGNVYYKG